VLVVTFPFRVVHALVHGFVPQFFHTGRY
jgi:hypothetical protein